METSLPPLKYSRDGLTVATTKRFLEAYLGERYRLIVYNSSDQVIAAGAGALRYGDALTIDDLAHILDRVTDTKDK